jgi:hypothetical protein
LQITEYNETGGKTVECGFLGYNLIEGVQDHRLDRLYVIQNCRPISLAEFTGGLGDVVSRKRLEPFHLP